MNTEKKQKSAVKDLTVGSPLSLILGYSLPMLAGLLFQQLYNIVDSVIVGKFIDVEALAAVGSTGSVNFLIIGFCIGVCSGFAIPVAQRFGAQDYAGLRRMVYNSAWLCVGFSAVLTLVVCLACRWILTVMQTPEDIMDGAYAYIFIIFLGIPVVFLYNILAGIIRSLGDSKTPLYFLAIASFINIGLDFVFIVWLHMHVDGAAYATVISQLISGLLCLIYMRKKFPILKPENKSEIAFDTHHAMILCNMGIPMGLQYSITAIGSVILQSAVNTLGSATVAAVTAAQRLGSFFMCPFDALGSAMATWGGQHVGAKKLERLKTGLWDAILLGSVYSVLAVIVTIFLGKPLLLLFLDTEHTQILSLAHQFLITSASFYIPLTLVNTVRFMIQGMGYSKFAMLAGVCEMVARGVMGFVFVPLIGYNAVGFASPLAWIFADAFLIPAFFYCYKKTSALLH